MSISCPQHHFGHFDSVCLRPSVPELRQRAVFQVLIFSRHLTVGTRTLAPSSATWRLLIALGIPFGLILGIGIQFCPESPRWLAKNGRFEEAYRSLAKVRGANPGEGNPWVEQEYADILAAIEAEKHLGDSTWIDCFRPQRRTLYRTLLGIALQAGQQLTGANYFFYYGTQIFTTSGISDPFVSQLILGAVNVVCTFGGREYLFSPYFEYFCSPTFPPRASQCTTSRSSDVASRSSGVPHGWSSGSASSVGLEQEAIPRSTALQSRKSWLR